MFFSSLRFSGLSVIGEALPQVGFHISGASSQNQPRNPLVLFWEGTHRRDRTWKAEPETCLKKQPWSIQTWEKQEDDTLMGQHIGLQD